MPESLIFPSNKLLFSPFKAGAIFEKILLFSEEIPRAK